MLISKPIRQGDVIALEEWFLGARYGWITRIGLIYSEVATRNGSLELIPNEVFVTQKIENLSFSDNLIRLNIPFGVSYGSDLKMAIMLAKSAAMSINRVLKIPEPKCLVSAFGDSSVKLLLRVWINDPQKWDSQCKGRGPYGGLGQLSCQRNRTPVSATRSAYQIGYAVENIRR